ncbi:MAG: hypothetical protein GY756_09725, partial [bacterium]|nr:hypothetical protein [bacterium]
MLLSEEIKQYKIIDNYEISNKYLFYFNFRDFNDRVFYINLSKLDTYYAPIPESSKNLDIPKNGPEHKFNGYPFIYWNFCKQKQKQLNLTCPETSNDSLIYRVWITNPVGKIGQPHGLIEIKCDSSNNWKGSLILM